MKRFLVYALMSLTLASLTACGGSKSDREDSSSSSSSSTSSSSSSSTSSASSSTSSSSTSSTSSSSSGTPEVDLTLGQSIYANQCHKCHGDDGTSPFDLNNDSLSFTDMVTEAETDMPKGTPEDCDFDCAYQVSSYIKQVLFANSATKPLNEPLAARIIKPHFINSIKDLFGVELSLEQQALLPTEIIDEKGFITAFDSQQLFTAHIEGFTRLSRIIANQLNFSELSLDLVGCDITKTNANPLDLPADQCNSTRECQNIFGTGASDCQDSNSATSVCMCGSVACASLIPTENSCPTRFIAELGLRTFRKPLSRSDQSRFEALFNTLAQHSDSSREDAANGLVRAMLQSPQFLYRLENETEGQGERLLNGYELASRLSFFLWQSSPDKTLLDFAQNMEQNGFDAHSFAAQVDRMLNNTAKISRAREQFWLDYTLSSTAAILGASASEAEALRESIVRTMLRASGAGGSESPLQDLFTTTEMVLSQSTAQSLGLASVGSGFQVYDTSSLPQRVGFLSHPGFLANIGSTSFVGRGVIFTERVLCREISAPPAGIEEDINDTANETQNLTPREASDYRFGLGGICQACHSTFEPIAFAFEQFDVLGRHQTTDNFGRDLLSYGYLQEADGSAGPSYSNVPELMNLLSNSEETSQCFSRNMMKFALGRHYAAHIDEQITVAHDDFVNNGGTFSALMRAVALNPLFRTLTVIEE